MVKLDDFDHVVCIDFEFSQPTGEIPRPLCVVWHEWRTGSGGRLWVEDQNVSPPYPTGEGVCYVGYYLSAKFQCHLALGWTLPEHALDLYVEYRNLLNGFRPLMGFPCWGPFTISV